VQELIDSLYAYNDWANAKIIALCSNLSDAQLDQPRAMGMGSLRATLFHILSAEIIWLERWQGVPWRPFPKDPEGMSVGDYESAMQRVAAERRHVIETQRQDRWRQSIDYMDSHKTAYHHQLRDLLLHVSHHGVHHRAQALSYLKQLDRKLAGGIDYIFHRLAQGSLTQSLEAVASLREYGLGVNDNIGPSIAWDGGIVLRSFEYSDWAVDRVLETASCLDDETLDRAFDMGQGSIRKILLHMLDAECWWNENWTNGPCKFPHTALSTSIAELSALWQATRSKRIAYLTTVDAAESQRVIELSFGGPQLKIHVGDSAVQLTVHGTHHRAQLVNLFRQVGARIGNIDLLYALADLSQPVV
jgi:uncharacterized damage-inducible protein DinB